MARKATESFLSAFLEGLREETHGSLCSITGQLVSALQERDVENARQTAARLQQELNLCDSDRATYFLAQVVTLLNYDDLFLHCDELSAWLLALEHELQRLRIFYCGASMSAAQVSSFDDTVPIQETGSLKRGTPGAGKRSGEGREY
jgi:hypothetical protein